MAEAEVDLFDVLQSAPVGTIILDDRDNQVLFWNNSVLGILGDLQGESFARAASHAFFHDQQDFRTARMQLAAQGSLRNFETRMWRANGSECWASVTMEPIRFENNAATLIWYFDITLAKRREHQLQQSQDGLMELLAAAPTGLALTDGPERICYWNNALLDIFPGTDGDPAIAIRAGIALAHAAIAGQGQGTTFSMATPDGVERFVSAWKYAVQFEGGPAELIWLHDVTELRRAERAAQAATVAKSAFLATMSHEIRTPMNGVMAIADLLAESPLTEDQASMIKIIQQSADSLLRVINDILDFSKLESSQMEIENISFRLNDVLDGVMQLLTPRAEAKWLTATVHRRGVDTAARIGDPLRLRQVLLNLVGNAIKFTAEGSVTLDVDATENQVVFRVIDTGIGISPAKLQKLLKPYQQGDAAMARTYGGTGLGLSISNALLALMGGRLAVESTMGCGSCFTVTLTLPRDDTAMEPPADGFGLGPDLGVVKPKFWEKADKQAAAANHAVILCVEDNQTNRAVLVRVLDRLGVVYDMVEDGAQALASLDRSRHGLVLTDGHMPVMDGWALARAIRQSEADNRLPRLPVILVTADAVSELAGQVDPGHFDNRLTKPLSRDRLEAAILEALPIVAALRVRPLEPETVACATLGRLDLLGLIALVGDEREDIETILQDFLTGTIALHETLIAALAAGDRTKVALSTHALRGSANYVGAHTVAEHAEALETAMTSSVALESLTPRFDALTRAVASLPDEIAASLAAQFG